MVAGILQPLVTYTPLDNPWGGIEGPGSVYGMYDISKTTPVTDSHGKNLIVVPPGGIIGTIPSSTSIRWLPAAFSSGFFDGATTVGVSIAQPFIAGDVVRVQAPYARILFAGDWAAADTMALTIGGQTFTYTAVAGDNVLSALATNFSNFLNNQPGFARGYQAFQGGNNTGFIAKDFLSTPAISATATTAGTGTGVIQDSLTALTPGQTIGTISASGVNTSTNELTFTANVSIPVLTGLPIGADSEPLALNGNNEKEVTQETNDVAGYRDGELWTALMPYYDERLLTLGNLKFNPQT